MELGCCIHANQLRNFRPHFPEQSDLDQNPGKMSDHCSRSDFYHTKYLVKSEPTFWINGGSFQESKVNTAYETQFYIASMIICFRLK